MTHLTEQRIEVSDAAEFGKVAVLYGGYSSERDVSLHSGNAVLTALRKRGIDAHGWDPAERSMLEFGSAGFDRVWIALHGTGGEDGALQGLLQWLELPYTGSGVLASALAMDKIRSKRLFRQADINTPDFFVVEHRRDVVRAAEEFGFPIIVKPACEGSSVGMSKIFDSNDIAAAAETALSFGGKALVEKCIVGSELTVAVLQGEALPSIRIETPRVFYDYRAKYESDQTRYFCPGTTDAEQEDLYREIAVRAFQELGCSGWGRVDFMQGEDGVPQVLEVNTVPGMTSHSLVPMAARQFGLDFDELCWRILETSLRADDVNESLGVAANDS